MKSLRYEYNRTYYKARAKIWLELKWKLFKLHIISKLFKLAYKIDSETFTRIMRELHRYDLEKIFNER